jgi:hypothetical protein
MIKKVKWPGLNMGKWKKILVIYRKLNTNICFLKNNYKINK